jgi:magnesium chelatase subunit I
VTPSTAGKVELDTWEDTDDDQVLDKLVRSACSNVFRRHFSVQELADLVQRFDQGGFTVEVGPLLPVETYREALAELPGLGRAREKLGEPDTPQAMAAVLEFLLEGLHLGKRLNKTALEGTAVYAG